MKFIVLIATILWLVEREGTQQSNTKYLEKGEPELNDLQENTNSVHLFEYFSPLLDSMRETYDDCEADKNQGAVAYKCYTLTQNVDNVPELRQFNLIIATFLYKMEKDWIEENDKFDYIDTIEEFLDEVPLSKGILYKFLKLAETTPDIIDIESVIEASKAFASGIFSQTILKHKARNCAAIIKRVEKNPRLFEAYLKGIRIVSDMLLSRLDDQLAQNSELKTDDVNNEEKLQRITETIYITMFWQPLSEAKDLSNYDSELTENCSLLDKWSFDFKAIRNQIWYKVIVMSILMALVG